jgi:hypothetical protein
MGNGEVKQPESEMEQHAPEPELVALDNRAENILKAIAQLSAELENDFKFKGWVPYGRITSAVKFPLTCAILDNIVASLVKAGKVIVDREFNDRRTGINMKYRRVRPAPEVPEEPHEPQ